MSALTTTSLSTSATWSSSAEQIGRRRDFEAIPYGTRQDRYDYQLTRMGLDLHVALFGLRQWEDKYLSDKPPTLARRKNDRRPLVAALVPKGTTSLPIGEAEFVAGPWP